MMISQILLLLVLLDHHIEKLILLHDYHPLSDSFDLLKAFNPLTLTTGGAIGYPRSPSRLSFGVSSVTEQQL